MATKSGGGRRYAGVAVGLFLAAAGTAQAQLNSTTTTTATTLTSVAQKPTTHIIEWDLTAIDQFDGNPGTMVVDTRGEDDNRLWFVSRLANASPQRVYRFTPAKSLKTADAKWMGWDLRPVEVGLSGGIAKMRPSHDRRFLFVRMPADPITDPTISTVQRIDTVTAQRTVWSFVGEAPTVVSDIAVDDRNGVFTTGVNAATGDLGGYVQLLDASTAPPVGATGQQVTVTRWTGLEGAGQCVSVSQPPDGAGGPGPSGVCNAGIDVHPNKQNLVYFVEKGGATGPNADPAGANGFITELNVDPRAVYTDQSGNIVSPLRRWPLLALSDTADNVAGPRVLKIDRSGKIWINTDTGHLVSLDPNTNRMTKHKVPGKVLADGTVSDVPNDLWGLSPDSDVVGYTGAGTNKVAMLFPRFNPVVVKPISGAAMKTPFTALADTEQAGTVSGQVAGDAKVVPVRTTRDPYQGTFVEAFVDEALACDSTQKPESLSPLGITANWGKAQGTFFYTVGLTASADPTGQAAIARRVGFARLPNKERLKAARDDDDADDGVNAAACPGFHAAEPDDDDADGVPNKWDTATARENMTGYDPAPMPAMTSTDYPVSTAATSLALIATAQADVATATLAIDVYNSIGTLMGTSGPMIGTAAVIIPSPGAGNFTVRVRNLSGTSVSHTPSIIVREPLLP